VVEVRFTGKPAWLITRHASLARAFRDAEQFPAGRAYALTTEPAVGRSFISMDGDEHRITRALATPAFRPRAVASYEDAALTAIAHELIDELARAAEPDLMARFVRRLPLVAISRLLGLPRDGEERFQTWARGLLAFPFDPDEARRCSAEFTEQLLPLLAERRRRPQDDVISELLQAELEGRRLNDEEVLSHVRLLFPTGAETTAGAIGNLLYALLSEPARWRRICAEPALRAAAIEELLRWENPVAIVPRVSAQRPARLDGALIPADSPVLFCIAAANRDPARFPDPDRFELERRPQEHLSFGPGPRQCPGLHLARVELRVALDALCARLPGMRLLDAAAAQPSGTVLRAPLALRVSRS
jgi:cytochrome P450